VRPCPAHEAQEDLAGAARRQRRGECAVRRVEQEVTGAGRELTVLTVSAASPVFESVTVCGWPTVPCAWVPGNDTDVLSRCATGAAAAAEATTSTDVAAAASAAQTR